MDLKSDLDSLLHELDELKAKVNYSTSELTLQVIEETRELIRQLNLERMQTRKILKETKTLLEQSRQLSKRL